MNKRILITLPYSYSYRNIVLTGVLEKLLSEKVEVLVVLPTELAIETPIKELVRKFPCKLKVQELIRPRPYSLANLLFTVSSALMQNIQSTYSYRIKQENSKFGDFKPYFKLFLLPSILPKSKKVFGLTKRLLLKVLYNKRVETELKNFRPDVIFTTLNHRVNEYFYLGFAHRYSIENISLVHSWDVITTKGSFVLSADRVLVWNKINELEYKYLVNGIFGINSKVEKVGIPQFDIYREQLQKVSEEEVKRDLEIPLNLEVVCYTTAVKQLYPLEKQIIKKLIQDFEKGCFPGKFLYVRLHPQESSSGYHDIKPRGKSYILSIPDEGSSNLEDKVKFNSNTLLNLFNELYVADIIVNMASSINLDAAALDKKVVNLSFDKPDGPNNDLYRSVERYYHTDHFSKVIISSKSNLVFSYDELFDVLKQKTEDYTQSNKMFKENYIYDFGNAAKNIVDKIINR